MEQLLELHEALQKSKGVAADKAVPLRVRFVVYPTNFYARWNHLESLRHKGAARWRLGLHAHEHAAADRLGSGCVRARPLTGLGTA